MTVLLLLLCGLAAIGGLLFGYDTGVISGAMLLIRYEFHLSSVMQEVIVSVTVGSAAIFSLIGGFINNRFGRKITVIIASFLFLIGSVIMAASFMVIFLIIGRILIGIAIGLSSMTVPIYLAECSPAHIRGILVTTNILFVTAGQFVASVINGAFSYDTTNGWRYMLGIAAVPALLQLIGFIFMPESPRWLVNHGRVEKAESILQSLRGDRDISQELENMKIEAARETKDAEDTKCVLLKILQTTSVRRALVIGCLLQMFQQLAGINTVMYYSATILKMSGIGNDSQAIWYSSLTSAMNFVFTVIGVFLIDRIGRRKLLFGSLTGVIASLAILGVGFYLIKKDSPPVTSIGIGPCGNFVTCHDCISSSKCGFCYMAAPVIQNSSCYFSNQTSHSSTLCSDEHLRWAFDHCPTHYSWVVVVGMAMYLAFFAPGMGPVPWAVNSEIYPTWARGSAASVTTMVNWIFNLLISMTFLSLADAITKAGVFWLYTGIVTVALVLFVFVLPETKGVQLESTDLFANGWCVFRRVSEEYRPLTQKPPSDESDAGDDSLINT